MSAEEGFAEYRSGVSRLSRDGLQFELKVIYVYNEWAESHLPGGRMCEVDWDELFLDECPVQHHHLCTVFGRTLVDRAIDMAMEV